jgi:hypothetical protein
MLPTDRGQTIQFTYNNPRPGKRKTFLVTRRWDTPIMRWKPDLLTDSLQGATTMQYDARNFLTRIAYPDGHCSPSNTTRQASAPVARVMTANAQLHL